MDRFWAGCLAESQARPPRMVVDVRGGPTSSQPPCPAGLCDPSQASQQASEPVTNEGRMGPST